MPSGALNIKNLKGFSRFLTGQWDEEIVLLEFLNILREDYRCSAGAAFLLKGQDYVLKSQINAPDGFGTVITERCLQILTADNARDYYCESVALAVDDLFLVPLADRDRLFGFVIYQTQGLPPGGIEMISILATQTLVALHNTGLAREKQMIEDIIATFTSGLDMHIYYPKFAEKLLKIASFDKLSITIPDPFRKDELIIYAEDSKLLETTKRVPLAGSAEAWVLNTGRPIFEEDFRISRVFREDNYLFSQGLRCLLRVPLMSNGRVIGTLNIGSTEPRAFGSKVVDMFSDIGARIGAAVENALVYETVNGKLSEALVQLETTFSATLDALTVLLDRRDSGTEGHSMRVINYALALAERVGVRGRESENLHLGALLHDIGKVAIPDSILFKPGKLDQEEWNVMRTHPEVGAEMVSRIKFLSPAMPVVLHHHEWYNGHGYPGRLSGEDIPLGARILSIADSFDAITSNRPYREALRIDYALEELKKCSGIQFCPECVDAFLGISQDDLFDIYNECQAESQLKNPYLSRKQFKM